MLWSYNRVSVMADVSERKVLRITLKRSGIGCPRRQRETLNGLGLTRVGRTVVRHDSPSVQGMIRKVLHLVEVRENGS
jgi:large subunit ribosomal protein L30